MRSMKLAVISLNALFAFSTPAFAEINLTEFRACVDKRLDANSPAADCVHEAQASCLSYDPAQQAASATLCFVEAKDSWSSGIRARLDEITESSDPNIAAIAGIEVKYDLLANLLQCDRMHDLARLTETPEASIALQKARCDSTATALALTKLLLQSRQLP